MVMSRKKLKIACLCLGIYFTSFAMDDPYEHENANNSFVKSCETGNLKIIKKLIDEELVAINEPIEWMNEIYLSPLHFAIHFEQLEIVKLLFQYGAAIDAPIIAHENIVCSGWTPLFHAARIGNIPIASFLIKHGAPINESLTTGFNHDETPLWTAALQANVPLVKKLLKHGAHANMSQGTNPLLHETIKYFSTSIDCKKEYYQIIDLLITHGAKINKKIDSSNRIFAGCTALHVAADGSSSHLLRLLLKRGARPQARDFDGRTALHVAVASENYKAIPLLYLFCNPKKKDKNGKTAQDLLKPKAPEKIRALFINKKSELLTIARDQYNSSLTADR